MRDTKLMLDAYRSLLTEYRGFTANLEKKYPGRTEVNQLPGCESTERRDWEAKIAGAEYIIGLEHTERIRREVGVKELMRIRN